MRQRFSFCTAKLLGYDAPIRGIVESITGGISASNAASSTQGLPNVDPIFTGFVSRSEFRCASGSIKCRQAYR